MLGTALPSAALAFLLTLVLQTQAQHQIIFSGSGINAPPSSSNGISRSQGEGGCDARGWLRAPDLLPGHIIDGDVQLILNGTHPDCFDVSAAHLGLRHKERGIVRYPSPAVELPVKPEQEKGAAGCSRQNFYNIGDEHHDIWFTPPWQGPWGRAMMGCGGSNINDTFCQDLEEWRKRMAEHDLWTVRVDETVDFEAVHPESIVGEDNGPLELLFEQDGVQQAMHKIANFSLAVPNVNFPPSIASNGRMGGNAQHLRIKSEQQTEYFLSIAWKNGTQIELPVGSTVWVPQGNARAGANDTEDEQQRMLVSKRALGYKEARNERRRALVGEERDSLDWDNEEFEMEDESKFCGADRSNNVTVTFEMPSSQTLVQGEKYNLSIAIEYDADHPQQIKKVHGHNLEAVSFPWAEKVVREAGIAPAYLHELLDQGHSFASQETIYEQRNAPPKGRSWGHENTESIISALSNESAIEGHPGRVRKQASVLISVQPKELPTTPAPRFVTRENALRFTVEMHCTNDHGQALQKDPLEEAITQASERWADPIGHFERYERFFSASLEASFPVEIAPAPIDGPTFGLRALPSQVDNQIVSYRSSSARAPVFLPTKHHTGNIDAPLLSETRRSTSEVLSQEQLEQLAQSSRRGRTSSVDVIKPYHRNACKHSSSSLSLCSAGDKYTGVVWRDFVWAKDEAQEPKSFHDDPLAWILANKVD